MKFRTKAARMASNAMAKATPDEDCLIAIRSALMRAEPGSARAAAARIGWHLDVLSATTARPDRLAAAIGTVRDAALVLLLALVRGTDALSTLVAALDSVDGLEASLAGR